MFLGLTGHRLKGWDCLSAGISTHAVSQQDIDSVETELIKMTSNNEVSNEAVSNVLGGFKSEEIRNHTFSLVNNMDDINRIFSQSSVEAIVESLQKEKTPFASKALKSMEAASPTSLKVAFRQISNGSKLSSLADVLRMEQRLVLR